MHPILFQFDSPSFLRGIFPSAITIYSYGFFIVLGCVLGIIYTSRAAKKELGIEVYQILNLTILLLIAAFLGGKFFVYFENLPFYWRNPSHIFKNVGSGFVFYGSLIFCIPVMLIYFRLNKIPALKMLDIMAINTCIVYAFGRLGCFMAGCCYGLPYDGILSVTFDDPLCLARPLHTALHPTQLYSVFLSIGLLCILGYIKKYKKAFDGQIFLLYIIGYAIGRSIIEIFRGDEARGFLIESYLSNSQVIALILISIAIYFYTQLYKKAHINMSS